MQGYSIKNKKILLAHSNSEIFLKKWHNNRQNIAQKNGYNLSTFCLTDYLPSTIFPYLDKKWRKRDRTLLKMYDSLGEQIAKSDIFIHFNGSLIHPSFLEQFKQIKIYHCADDPESSNVLSKPVAPFYDIHAISNPSCIDLYKSWGCNNVSFWPLGALFFDDRLIINKWSDRKIKLSYIGNKFGAQKFRYVHRIPVIKNLSFNYYKKRFLDKIERRFPFLEGYGEGWAQGKISNKQIIEIYNNSLVGLNLHNSLGPINHRLFDLAAFGVCQICDNKQFINTVFEDGKEIISYNSYDECVELCDYYVNNLDKAELIAKNSLKRFKTDYTDEAIWLKFVDNVNNIIINNKNILTKI